MNKSAVFSECRRYRYVLTREWDSALPIACFVMLNPSTANDKVDDPTIRSCIRLCKAMGFGGFEVVNLFAYRATKPVELFKAQAKGVDIVGNDNVGNDNVIRVAARAADKVICAWGAHPKAQARADKVLRDLLGMGERPWCFGVTKDQHPRHPLYVKTGTKLIVYAYQATMRVGEIVK